MGRSGGRGRSKTKKLCLSSDPGNNNQTFSTSSSSFWDQPPPPQQSLTKHGLITPNNIRTPGGTLRPKNLGRIKSLSKIETRSPIVKKKSITALTSSNHQTPSHTPLLSPSSPHFAHGGIEHTLNEMESLHTVNTGLSLSSRLMGIVVPQSLYRLRNYYNDFTTIDWVQAFISKNRFNYEVTKRRWIVDENDDQQDDKNTMNLKIPIYYKAYLVGGKWVLICIIAFLFSLIAFFIDKIEIVLVGFKHGYCKSNWLISQLACCSLEQPQLSHMNVFKSGALYRPTSGTLETCESWVSWSELFKNNVIHKAVVPIDFVIYVLLTLLLAYLACVITLTTKITSHLSPITLSKTDDQGKKSSESSFHSASSEDHDDSKGVKPRVIYTACGSGVPEVKTILSGFFIRRFLGTYTLFAKTITLILAIASGMSLGKEGPYVHLATCVGNIMSRFFPYINNNDLMKKQILSASASSGVALAFGSPLGGVLFILEEINNYLPLNQLFQIFFCAIISTLFLKFLNPYGTGKTVLFELQYFSDWKPIELLFFVTIGIFGGIFGAVFVKFIHWWAKTFRNLLFIKDKPIVEVFFISLLTGVVSFWNPYTKQASAELVLELATPCGGNNISSLCNLAREPFIHELHSLLFAFITKIILTFVTFGLKLPCGIYVPSMVVGALFGRIFGMSLHLIGFEVDLGIYSMISAGAFMAGVTRMNITLVTILFELTSSYTYVLPISIAISVANWMGSVLEKNSLYESLLILNDYPFMSSETEPLDPMITAGDIINESDTYKHHRTLIVQGEDQTLQTQFMLENSNNIVRTPACDSRLPVNVVPDTFAIHDTDNNDNRKVYIDVTASPYVAVSVLQLKLVLLAEKSLLDGCIPLVMNDTCVGLIFFAELEFCLDKLETFCEEYSITEEVYCKVLPDGKFYPNQGSETTQMMIRSNHALIKNSYQIQTDGIDYFNYRSLDSTSDEITNDSSDFFQMFYDLIDLTDSLDYNPIFINYDSELTLAHLIFDKIGNRVIVLLKDGKYYGVLHKKVLIDYCRQEERLNH